MKVILDSYLYFVSKGGISRYIYHLKEGLKREGIKITLLVFSHPKNFFKIKRRKNDDLILIPFPLRLLVGLSGSAFLPPLELFHRKEALYHATCGIALPSRKKTILTIHDLTFIKYPYYVKSSTRLLYLKGIKKSLSFADRIIVPSNTTKKDLMEIFLYPREKIHVIPMDANLSEIKEKGEILKKLNLKEGEYFIFIGNIERRKNLRNLIIAFAEFYRKNHSYKLIICGGSGWDTEYSEKIKEMINKTKNVILFESPSDDTLFTLLKNSRALILISHYEGFGIPVVEAMKLGVPVIVSKKGALPEVAGEAGIYVNKDNPKDIADKMEWISQDEKMWEYYSNKGKERGKIFSWEKTIRKTIEVYKNVLK